MKVPKYNSNGFERDRDACNKIDVFVNSIVTNVHVQSSGAQTY